MDIKGFTKRQKQALLDLLVLGMYTDRHLSAVEDARLQRLLDTIPFSSDYARQQFVDASFTRVSRQAASAESARTFVSRLARDFSGRNVRRRAYDALEGLLRSDGRIDAEETRFLAMVEEVFEL